MERKTTAIMAVALGLIAISGAAFAAGFNTENREAVENAISSNDYEAWRSLMTQDVTEDTFNRIRDMYQNREEIRTAMENGDFEAWKAAVKNMYQQRIDSITQEEFNRMSENYQARMNGEFEDGMGYGPGAGCKGGMLGHGMGIMGMGMR